MNRFDLAGVRSGIARVAARLRAESARVPSLARSRAGRNSIYRTLVGSAIVMAGSVAGLLSTRLGASRSWRGTPPFRREAKASCRIDFPPARVLLLAVLILGVVEPRFAHGAEDDGPREKQAEAGPTPVDRESGASHQGTPSPVSAARPRGPSRILPPPLRDGENEASVPNTQDLASCAVGAAQVGRLPADSETLADSRERRTEFPQHRQGRNLQLGVSAAWRPRSGAVGRRGGDDAFAARHWLVPMHGIRPQESKGT